MASMGMTVAQFNSTKEATGDIIVGERCGGCAICGGGPYYPHVYGCIGACVCPFNNTEGAIDSCHGPIDTKTWCVYGGDVFGYAVFARHSPPSLDWNKQPVAHRHL